ncbi:MAG: hypothetical protein GX066_09315 [Clostridiaceae bacterium]|nr:hypothetical protein [Clostridiaceae bacterium]
MKKFCKSPRKMVLLTAIFICAVIAFQIVYAAVIEPGSEGDPLVTKSYIEEVMMPKIKQEILEAVKGSSGSPEQPLKFEVVSVQKGQKLIGGAGTELILRMGKATVIATQKGGLADTTQGVDLPNGVPMPANHLLIIPVDDGRGFSANEDVLVMVKGTYRLE